MSDTLMEFRLEQVKELTESLVNINLNNHCVISYSTFLSTYLKELHQMATDPDYMVTRWVNLTGNMFARLVVVNDEQTAVLYDIPSLLSQGYTASPDPDNLSLNDQLAYAANNMDILPEIAINSRHRLYMDISTQLEEDNYEEIRDNAAQTVALLNHIFETHNLSLIDVPTGLEDGGKKPVDKPSQLLEKEVAVDVNDCEML